MQKKNAMEKSNQTVRRFKKESFNKLKCQITCK